MRCWPRRPLLPDEQWSIPGWSRNEKRQAVRPGVLGSTALKLWRDARPSMHRRRSGAGTCGLSAHGHLFGWHAILEQLAQLLAQFRRILVMVHRHRVIGCRLQ